MTIILVMANEEQVVQVSDRRLSSPGRVHTDEANKAGSLVCADGRFLFAFTGLASVGSFKSMPWLLETLHEVAAPSYRVGDILVKLKSRATSTFREHPALRHLRPDQKLLSVLFSGYLVVNGRQVMAAAKLSNFEDLLGHARPASDQFAIHATELQELADPFFVTMLGNWGAAEEDDLDKIQQLVVNRKPASALIGAGIACLSKLADRPASGITIGKQFSSIRLPATFHSAIESHYHTNVKTLESFMPAAVTLLPESCLLVLEGSIRAEGAAARPVAVPKVHRNAPCPCGSSLRYRFCHGQQTQKSPAKT